MRSGLLALVYSLGIFCRRKIRALFVFAITYVSVDQLFPACLDLLAW